MQEIWKPIKNFNCYEISNLGRVKSFKRYRSGKILNRYDDFHGYLFVKLYINGKSDNKKIHRLVLETFNQTNNMDQLDVNHKDGIKSNNELSNLEWCSRSENIHHAFNIGLQNNKGKDNPMFGKQHSYKSKEKMSEIAKNKYKGENNPSSILTKNDVIQIRKHLKEGKLTQKEIGKIFNVSHITISDIKRNKTWNH